MAANVTGGRRSPMCHLGETRSYGESAARNGRPGAARAVGAVIGRNPLSILVPFHRVIGASGSLTGFAGGLDIKAVFSRLRGAVPSL